MHVKGLVLKLDFHAFGGGSHLGIVVARLLHDIVDAFVTMVWIVMEKHQFLGAALHDDIYGFAPVAESPAAFLSRVLVRQVL